MWNAGQIHLKILITFIPRTEAIGTVTKINNVEVTESISPPPPVLKEHAGRLASAAQLLLECLESRLAEQLTTLDVARVQRAACIDDDSHARVGQELAPSAEQRAKLGASDVQARECGAVREVEQLERRAEHRHTKQVDAVVQVKDSQLLAREPRLPEQLAVGQVEALELTRLRRERAHKRVVQGTALLELESAQHGASEAGRAQARAPVCEERGERGALEREGLQVRAPTEVEDPERGRGEAELEELTCGESARRGEHMHAGRGQVRCSSSPTHGSQRGGASAAAGSPRAAVAPAPRGAPGRPSDQAR